MNKNPDSFVKQFCEDSLKVLKGYDEQINKNLTISAYKDDYNYPKGLAVYSMTEPILKFMIFSGLCKDYLIFPEAVEFYKGRELLDLALFIPFKDSNGKDSCNDDPDIAIEIKWGGLKKNGEFTKWGVKCFIDDMLKLHKNCTVPNKYIMQFMVIHDEKVEIDQAVLKEQILSNVDRRKIRGRDLEFIYYNDFDTMGFSNLEKWKFGILLWKIV